VLSYIGGEALDRLPEQLGARAVAPLYGSVDPLVHRLATPDPQFACDLSYLGTYAVDRQATLETLFIDAARARPGQRFLIARRKERFEPLPRVTQDLVSGRRFRAASGRRAFVPVVSRRARGEFRRRHRRRCRPRAEIQVKAAQPASQWIWGAIKLRGAILHELYALWREPGRGDEYLGTLVNAWLARGESAYGLRAGEAYVDVGTLHGYREALRLLAGRGGMAAPVFHVLPPRHAA
jgi:hypothetical protein